MSYDGTDPTVANISKLATMFGVGRMKVRSGIEKACIKSVGNINGNNLFKIAKVAEVIFGAASYMEGGDIDPATLKPSEQKDWWAARKTEIEVKVKVGEYTLASDVLKDNKRLQDSLKEKIQSFPDILERDKGITPDEVESMISLCDNLTILLRASWEE